MADGIVEDVEFSVKGGVLEDPFEATLSAGTPGATIRYTTDGSWLSENNGKVYSEPILIDRTTPLKAIAFKKGYLPSDIVTQTYVFG